MDFRRRVPINEPWWKLVIKWMVIIYGAGAAITFVLSFVIYSGGITSIGHVFALSIFTAAL
jgi:hypothetical protein